MKLVEREAALVKPQRRRRRNGNGASQDTVEPLERPMRQRVLRKPPKLSELAERRLESYEDILAHVHRELAARTLVSPDSVPDLGWGRITRRAPLSFMQGLLAPLRSLQGARELGDIRDSLIRLAAYSIAYAYALEQRARGHDTT